ncbi:bleomycin hydrolase [Boothiomyces sp. JEL0866]|nr:bleomycin hydrolase [Boothiomyces sp. JEL0866]
MKRFLSTRILGIHESPKLSLGDNEAFKVIQSQLQASNFTGKKNQFRILYNIPGLEPIVGVVGLGPNTDTVQNRHNTREAAAVALRQLKALDSKSKLSVVYDRMGDLHATAEGATLSSYAFEHFVQESKKQQPVTIESVNEDQDWKSGVIAAASQNLARTLMETPANYLTPTIFCDRAIELFKGIPNVEVVPHGRDWAEEQKMGAFISVSNGSSQPLKYLEIRYNGGKAGDSPLALVGKGVTFDSGGISIKPSAGMAMMKGDMGGAAVVLSSLHGIASLGLPLNVVASIPLTENMPSGSATKPGDVVIASNGLSIEVDNTDAEGRLILADAIHYTAKMHQPHTLLELSTLTGAMDVALGTGYAGVFTNSDIVWEELLFAGLKTGDEFWRMPLSDVYAPQIKSKVADLKNVGGRGAGACTAALFLKSFIPEGSKVGFAHIDIAGVMHNEVPSDLLGAGMTGRPTRSIIEFSKRLSAN